MRCSSCSGRGTSRQWISAPRCDRAGRSRAPRRAVIDGVPAVEPGPGELAGGRHPGLRRSPAPPLALLGASEGARGLTPCRITRLRPLRPWNLCAEQESRSIGTVKSHGMRPTHWTSVEGPMLATERLIRSIGWTTPVSLLSRDQARDPLLGEKVASASRSTTPLIDGQLAGQGPCKRNPRPRHVWPDARSRDGRSVVRGMPRGRGRHLGDRGLPPGAGKHLVRPAADQIGNGLGRGRRGAERRYRRWTLGVAQSLEPPSPGPPPGGSSRCDRGGWSSDQELSVSRPRRGLELNCPHAVRHRNRSRTRMVRTRLPFKFESRREGAPRRVVSGIQTAEGGRPPDWRATAGSKWFEKNDSTSPEEPPLTQPERRTSRPPGHTAGAHPVFELWSVVQSEHVGARTHHPDAWCEVSASPSSNELIDATCRAAAVRSTTHCEGSWGSIHDDSRGRMDAGLGTAHGHRHREHAGPAHRSASGWVNRDGLPTSLRGTSDTTAPEIQDGLE